MNKQYNLKLDLKFKCHNSKMKFDEFDKNTSDFYINLTKDNEVVDIDNAILTLVALKPDGTTESQFLKVKENKVYCNLKESMKDVVGEYSCMAMLTLKDKVIIVEQPISYTINENKLLRALNREVEGTERFSLLTDMLSRLSDIENSEKIRISNESDRLLLQKTLEDLIKEIEEAELDRKNHEVLREKTHQKLKEEIKKSEVINANTQATNNVAKELINSVNLTHEEIKKTNKDTKAVLESTREFENEARDNEEDRQKLFGNAQITLKELKNSEVVRERNENTRISNEEARKLKISNFETRYNNLIEITETLKSELSELNSQSETNEANRVDAENLRNQRYEEFETAYNSLIYDIQSQLENTNTVKADLISKVNNAKDDMTLTVQTALDNLTKKVDSKIVEVNNAKNEMIRQANDTVAKANQSIGQVNAISNKANETNSKVNEALVKTTKCIDDVNKTKDDLVNQFNALAPSEQSNAEVQLARTDIAGKTHSSLQERLIADNKMQSMLFEEVEGSYITTETVPSNIQEVEIFGNTYQDPNTLEIFSIGKEIEGTSGVKIDISSCNKNLFDKNLVGDSGTYLDSSGGISKDSELDRHCTDFIKVNPNTPITIVGIKNSGVTNEKKQIYIREYNKEKIKGVGIVPYVNIDNVKFTTSNDTYYIRFSVRDADLDRCMVVQEENAESTSYVKHEKYNKEIILPCKLEKVIGYKDRFYYDGSEWVIEKIIISDLCENMFGRIYITEGEVTDGLVLDINPTIKLNISTASTFLIEGSLSGGKWGDANTIGKWYRNPSNVVLIIPKGESLEDAKKRVLGKTAITHLLEPQIIRTGYTDPNLLSLKTSEDKTHIYFGEGMGAEGTIKCRVPKSLGASVSSNTKSIEGVKQELDNVKSLVDTVGTMEISSDTGFATVDNTIDGYIDDVEIRGKSLVNLWNINNLNLTGSCVKTDSTIKVITDSINTFSNFYQRKSNLFKANTKYSIIVNILKNTLQSKDRIHIVSRNGNDDTDTDVITVSGSGGFSIGGGELGIFIKTLTTPSNIENRLHDLRSFVQNTNLVAGNELELQLIVLEGDHTANPPSYFEGLKSVGQDNEIEVLSCNENLFDINNLISGSVQTGDGMDVDDVTKCKTDFTKLPIGTYTLSKNTEEWSTCLAYDEYKRYIGTLFNNRNKENTFTINNTHKYIRFKFDYTLEYATTDNIQLEKGSNTSSYTHHQSNKRTLLKPITTGDMTTFESIILRGINENVYDSIEKHDNKYKLFERCGEINLDGSDDEKWIINSAQPSSLSNTHIGFVYNINIDNAYTGSGNSKLICNRFQYSNDYHNFGELIKWMNNSTYNKITIVIEKSKLSTPDVEGFRLWLQSNPIIAIYQLAKLVITELPYDLNLRTFANQSNFIINGGVINPSFKFNIKNCIANTVKGLMNKVQVIEESFNKIVIEGFRKVLAGDMQSLAYMVYDMEEVEQEETSKLINYLPLE